jgi:hypothetical protein
VLNLASGRPLPAAIYRKPFTSVKTGSFILKTVEPGTHTITVFSNENQASLPFSAEAGRKRFSIHAMSTADGEEGNRMAAWRYRRQVYLIEVFSELLFNISNKIPPSLLNV